MHQAVINVLLSKYAMGFMEIMHLCGEPGKQSLLSCKIK